MSLLLHLKLQVTFCFSFQNNVDTEKKFESFMKEIEDELESQELDGEFFGVFCQNS